MTLITRSGNSFRNTPTVRTSGGNRLTISDTLETATCRGDGAKTNRSHLLPQQQPTKRLPR